MNKKIYFILFILISTLSFAQEKIKGNRNVTRVKTDIDNFKKIVIGEEFEVKLIKNNNAAIQIETDENLHSVLNFVVIDSTFYLRTTKKIRSKKRLNITVYFTNSLNEIELNDDAELEGLNAIEANDVLITINDYAKADLVVRSKSFKLVNNNKSRIQLDSRTKLDITSPKVNLKLNESSNSDIKIDTDELEVSLKRRATLKIAGDTDLLKVTAIASTDFLGKKLTANETEITAKGKSENEINSSKKITISASDKSEIELFGDPKIIIEEFSDKAQLRKN